MAQRKHVSRHHSCIIIIFASSSELDARRARRRTAPMSHDIGAPPGELKVYVGKLPDDVSDGVLEHILRELSAANGAAARAPSWRRVRDPTTNAPKRFGFASFYDCESALRAMRVLDGLRARAGDDALVCNANSATRAATEAYLRTRDASVAAKAMAEDARKVEAIKRMFSERAGEEEGEIGGAEDEAEAGRVARFDERREDDDVPEAAGALIVGDDDGALRAVDAVVDGLPPPPPSASARPEELNRGGRPRRSGLGDELTPLPPAPRFRRQEYEANERTERLFREREKALDDLVHANTRERARRMKIDKEKKAERRKALKRDLASDSDDDSASGRDEDVVLPLWERSERARARRKRFRELEMADDAADAALEIEEAARNVRVDEDDDAVVVQRSIDVHVNEGAHTNGRSQGKGVGGPAPPLASVSGFQPRAGEAPMKMHTAFGLTGAKKSGLTAALKPKQTMFSNADDDDDDDDDNDRKPRRGPTDAKIIAADVASLIQRVPTAEADIFAYPIDWNTYTSAQIHRTVRKWITKKTTELLGEEEPALVDFIADKLARAPAPDALVADLLPVLDAESNAFVLKLWRLVIFEILKALHA